MGCATSKVDNLPAVALCRDRCNFLEEALYQSYALADAHAAYMQFLKTIGPTLHHFFDQNVGPPSSNGDNAVSASRPSKSSPPASSKDHSLSSSNADSHIQFDSDSDEEETDKDRIYSNYPNHKTQTSSVPDMFMSINYMKNQPTQLVSHDFSNHNYDSNTYQNYELNSEFSAQSPHGWASKSPPPPAPSSSAWDFFNFFETYELPYAVTTNKEVKFTEGTRDLEDGSAKQTHRVENFDGTYAKVARKEDRSGLNESAENVNKEEKNENSKKDKVNERSDWSESKSGSGKRSVSEVMTELQGLFERASESGNEVLKMLDTGKFRYHQKNSVYQLSSKMHAVTPSLSIGSSSCSTEKIGSVNPGSDGDVSVNFRNLSSTLKKLCMWENKLFHEVKAEEKLLTIHARKFRQMKRLDEKGAEAHKVESARTLVRTLSTKIKVAFHVIDKISITINELRDEELWPQISELINRLFGMWKSMLECHRCQSQTVADAKSLVTVALNGSLNSSHLEVAIQLEIELQNWKLIFSNWVKAQKGCVRALNGWLMRCLLHEPEETPDGIVPYSPGRFGAPHVFVIANQWSRAFDRLSEKEVIEAIHLSFMSINQLLEQYNVDLQQRIIADKDIERKMILEREKQKTQKIMQARAKKMTPLSGEESELTRTSSSQLDLEQIFVATERFAADSKKVYEELRVRIEECRHQPESDA